MTSDLMNMHEAAYCRNLLRVNDRDFFFLSLFAKGAARAALWGIFAFHYEIRKAAQSGKEPTLRLIRLQWWDDALTALPDHPPPQNEILPLLKEVMQNYTLRPEDFTAVIEPYRATGESTQNDIPIPADALLNLLGKAPDFHKTARAFRHYAFLKSRYGRKTIPFMELRVAWAERTIER